jgi:3-hydroxy-9,10-secoandrosta-1,3,5(10)-triene-9,17-dione monooxygenase reductase component
VAAITVNSFVSISLDPRLVMWSLSNSSDRYERFADQERWGVSILSADQQDLAATFATKGARLAEAHEVERVGGGVPVLRQALARFDCRTGFRNPAGDHLLIFGLVERFDVCDGAALLYHRGAFGERA